MKKTLGKRLLSGLISSFMSVASFATPLLHEGIPWSANADGEDDNIRIEARVIFGDYNDDGEHTYTNSVPKLTLKYRNSESTNNIKETVTAKPVVDSTPARKDWCYQYNYVWEVPKFEGNDSSYYVAIEPSGTNFDRNKYNVYYLKDDALGHPGEKKNDGYKTSAQHVSANEDQVFYIFLDPKEDWQHIEKRKGNPNYGKYVQPKTLDLSMKKRWDGHNESEINLHPKEKIKVQLQRKKADGTWAEYKPGDFKETYSNWYFYKADNGKFVDKNTAGLLSKNVAAANRLQVEVNGKMQDYKDKNGNYIDKTKIVGKDDVARANRLQIDMVYDQWNNIVLNLEGKNHPQHFTQGYYFAWNNLPYGEYRVVELQSFYDENDNDVYDAGVDRDTSSEYNYMEFPPSRDSNGVLHIQNFTKVMKIEVGKKWFVDKEGKTQIPQSQLQGDNKLFNSKVDFEIYRTKTPLDKPYDKPSEHAADLVKIGTFTTNDEGFARVSNDTKDKNKESEGVYYNENLKPQDYENGPKYYYYVKEAVSADGNFIQINPEMDNGFVKSDKGTYYVDYESGDSRVFNLANKIDMKIKVKKNWTDEADKSKEMKFVLLRAGKDYGSDVEIVRNPEVANDSDDGAFYVSGDDTKTKTFKILGSICSEILESLSLSIIA